MLLRTASLVVILCALFSLDASAQSVTVSLGSILVQWSNTTGNPLVNGSANNPGSSPVNVTTTWTNLPTNNTLTLYIYFSSSTSALAHTGFCTGSCPDIPSSAVEASINGGARTAMTGSGPFGAAGASLAVFSTKIVPPRVNGTRTDSLAFNINLSSRSLPPDTYSGTLVVQAQMAP